MKNLRTAFLSFHSVSLVLIMVLGSAMAFAANTPTSLAGATVVNAAHAKSLMESGAVMIDARVANEYAELHIKGAKNVPYKEKSEKSVTYDVSVDHFDLAQLPADKKAPIIFSCNGPECWKSYKATRAAIKAGYKNVYWLRGGLPEWQEKGYPVE
jgi:rhodanese-related sulfurtransferase